ncbi:hypothetical protein GM3709_2628 [Geminocystis sp. NIES-3709]|nr:hypothetical protein GM3709_2628 [Geminocystis sp. NIES-3709]
MSTIPDFKGAMAHYTIFCDKIGKVLQRYHTIVLKIFLYF